MRGIRVVRGPQYHLSLRKEFILGPGDETKNKDADKDEKDKEKEEETTKEREGSQSDLLESDMESYRR
jgi:hypothetical protein